MLGPAHRVRRVDCEDLADHEPVEQHPDRGEVQFDGRLGVRGLQPLDIGGDVDRLDVGEFADPVLLDPGEKVAGGPVIGHAGVLVADRGGEELQEAPRGVVTGIGNRGRHRERIAPPRRARRRRGRNHRRHVLVLAAHAGAIDVNPDPHLPPPRVPSLLCNITSFMLHYRLDGNFPFRTGS